MFAYVCGHVFAQTSSSRISGKDEMFNLKYTYQQDCKVHRVYTAYIHIRMITKGCVSETDEKTVERHDRKLQSMLYLNVLLSVQSGALLDYFNLYLRCYPNIYTTNTYAM